MRSAQENGARRHLKKDRSEAETFKKIEKNFKDA
jgi:hypothetical protein